MTIQEWGAIGEVIGGVAVVVSLVYLAVQIRQNTASGRTATQQQLASMFSGLNMIMGSSPDAARIYLQGLDDPDELDDEEVPRFAVMFQSAIRLYENVFYQRQAGALADPAWFGWVQSMKLALGAPGARAWWQRRRFLFHSEFCQFVEENIQTDDATSLMSRISSRPPKDAGAP